MYIYLFFIHQNVTTRLMSLDLPVQQQMFCPTHHLSCSQLTSNTTLNKQKYKECAGQSDHILLPH